MAQKLFTVPELMLRIIGFATIRSIVALGGTCNLGREYMQEALAGFIHAMLDPYFPSLGVYPIFFSFTIFANHQIQLIRSLFGNLYRLPKVQ